MSHTPENVGAPCHIPAIISTSVWKLKKGRAGGSVQNLSKGALTGGSDRVAGVIPKRSGAGQLSHSDSMFADDTVAIAQVKT